MPARRPLNPQGAASPPPAIRSSSVSPARAVAFSVLRRVFEEGAWADRALHAEAERLQLEGRDRALAARLVFGTVQRRATLDHVIEILADRPVTRLDAPVVAALRLGLQQLLFLDRVPAHAAVHESVELAKRHARRGAGLVNAVLRRGAHEAGALLASLKDDTPQNAVLAYSYPLWLVEMWWEAFGAEDARALMRAGNTPAEASLRVNTLKASRDDVRTELEADGVAFAAQRSGSPDLPESLVIDGPFDAHRSAAWHAGRLMPQSRAAIAVGHLLDPQPGDRVLDLCAAPGGKTTHLAALTRGRSEIVAVERHGGRAEALKRTTARMGASEVTVVCADGTDPDAVSGMFDRILVDPPCSDLGTVSARPDVRWRKSPGDPARLSELQGRLLAAGASRLNPGGTMVYSTCTLSPTENERRIARFLDENPDFEPVAPPSRLSVWKHATVPYALQTLPHRDGTDGFFMVAMRKADA